jgi:glutamine cyclotransferase
MSGLTPARERHDRPRWSRGGRQSWPARILCGALLLGAALASHAAVPLYRYEIVHVYPHDPRAFTEGLFYLNGFLYESTGIEQHSSIRKVQLESGKVVQKIDIPTQYFGEGIVNWEHRLIGLTWKSGVGFVYDLASFRLQRKFFYQGEGWALTQDGKRIIMSDGTPELRLLDPVTLKQIGHIDVTLEGKPVRYLNELEWVKGEIYANVWQTNWILRINPTSGAVVGVIDLNGILSPSDRAEGQTDVLNGIAYDAKADRLFVTGKYWPKLFEIRLQNAGQVSLTAR